MTLADKIKNTGKVLTLAALPLYNSGCGALVLGAAGIIASENIAEGNVEAAKIQRDAQLRAYQNSQISQPRESPSLCFDNVNWYGSWSFSRGILYTYGNRFEFRGEENLTLPYTIIQNIQAPSGFLDGNTINFVTKGGKKYRFEFQNRNEKELASLFNSIVSSKSN